MDRSSTWTRRITAIAATAFLTLGLPDEAFAGMPRVSTVLDRLAAARLDSISFFAVVFLGCAWVVQRVWNGLQADFTRLPRLSYPRAVGLTTLWAALAILVLTMISGARELLTPGAWEPQGAGYKLTQPTTPESERP